MEKVDRNGKSNCAGRSGDVAAHIAPALEKLHLVKAKQRRDDIRYGKVQAVEGNAALHRVRKVIAPPICYNAGIHYGD